MFFIISFFLCSLQTASGAIGQADSHIYSVTNAPNLFAVLTPEEISKLRRSKKRSSRSQDRKVNPAPTTEASDALLETDTASVSTDPVPNSSAVVDTPDDKDLPETKPLDSVDMFRALINQQTSPTSDPYTDCKNNSDYRSLRNLSDFCVDKDTLKDIGRNCTEELKQYHIGNHDSNKWNVFSRCKDKYTDLKDYPKCEKRIKAEYKTALAASEKPDDKEKEEAAEKAKRKLKSCKRKHEASSTNSRCEQAAEELKDLKKEFNSSCGELGGEDSCIRTLRSCNECDPSGQVTTFSRSSDLDCVVIKNSAVCPELTKDLADDLEKDRDKYEEKIKDLADKIAELKEDKSRLEGEESDEKLSYEAEMEALKAEKEGADEELENSLKNLKGEVDAALQSAIAKVKTEFGKAQSMQFKISNRIYDANRKYRDSKNQVYLKCKQESADRLSNYRKARKAAIKYGNFKQETIFEMLQNNRVSFAQKDDARRFRYYDTCLAKNKYILASLKEDLEVELHRINQETALITAQFKSLQVQLSSLEQEADTKKQTALQEYASQLQKIASRSQKQSASGTKVYSQKARLLSKHINEKNMEIIQTQGQLQETRNKFHHSQEMYNRLRAAGSPSEDKSSLLAEASEKHSNLQEEWTNAFDTCGCTQGSFDSDSEEQECQRIKKVGRLVEPDHDNLKRKPKPRKKKPKSTGNPHSSE